MENASNLYPSHVIVEKTVLSIFIKYPNHILAHLLRVKPAYFHVQQYALMFETMHELVKDYTPIDEPILASILKGIEPNIDWNKELADVMIWGELIENLPYFLDKLEENFTNRQLVALALMVSNLNQNEAQRIDQAIFKLLDLKKMLEQKNDGSISKLLVSFVKNGGMVKPEELISSGFIYLDQLINGGFEKGQLMVIGGRPGMGKSALLMNFCNHIIDTENKKVLFLSLRMNPKHFLMKLLANRLDFPLHKIIMGQLPDNYDQSCEGLLNAEREGRFKFHSVIENDFIQILAEINNRKITHGLDVVIIDNLQQLDDFNPAFYQNRNNTLGTNLRRLKQMAVELGFTLLIGSDLSRTAERRASLSNRPMLHDLKDSGWIEELADQVLMIYRPAYYQLVEWEDGEPTHGQAELRMCKNILGILSNFRLAFNEENFRFSYLNDISYQPDFMGHMQVPDSRKNEFE
ncbi:MAG: DnaB-like helicase C-terminal domain-containing protein [bacterium]|nr:DnaB-like helicase C-terminal domain-containing protein [bacterium]